MSDDLVKRLRDGCSCNIDTSPCAAEEECRDAYAAADRIEQLAATNKELETKLAEAGARSEVLETQLMGLVADLSAGVPEYKINQRINDVLGQLYEEEGD